MNPDSKPKKRLFNLGGGSTTKRLVIAAVGGIILLLMFWIVFSLIFSGGTNNTEKLVGIAADQSEITRIAALGEKDASSSDTRNFASTVRLTITSAQQDLLELLGKQGRKVQNKELAASENADTDQALTVAKQTNQFDEVFEEIIRASLVRYQQSLNDAFQNSNSQSEKATLQTLYNNARVLNEQKNSAQ